MGRLVVAAVVLVFTAGCRAGEARELPPVSGGTPEQLALVRSIVEGLAPTEIRRVRILAPEPAGTPLGVDQAELRVVPKDGATRSGRAQWEQLLIAGAFRDRSAEQGMMPVISAGGVEGVTATDLRGRQPTSPARPASAADRMSIARMVAGRAQVQGATIEQLDVVSPYGPAVVLTVRVADPAAFLRHRLLPLIDGWWADPRLEGSYVRVLDRDGSVAEKVWNASRLTSAGYGARPDLAGCDPIVHYFVERAPPPCPAD